MRTKKYEDVLEKLLQKQKLNPTDPSIKNAIERTTSGLATKAVTDAINRIPKDRFFKDFNMTPREDGVEKLVPTKSLPKLPSPTLDFQDRSKMESKDNQLINDTPKPQDINNISYVDSLPNPATFSVDFSKSKDLQNKDAMSGKEIPSKSSLGTTGTIIKSVAPTVLASIDALTTKSNVNAFSDVGNAGLNTLEKSRSSISAEFDNQLNSILESAKASKAQIDSSTNSLNVNRAFKTVIDSDVRRQKTDVGTSKLRSIRDLDNVVAQQQNFRDQAVAQGNDITAERNAQDRSQIINNFDTATQAVGSGMEHLEAMSSSDKYNESVISVINMMLDKGEMQQDANGKFIFKLKK